MSMGERASGAAELGLPGEEGSGSPQLEDVSVVASLRKLILMQRESARVEMLMREHAYVGLRYGRLFGLATRRTLLSPGRL